MVDSVHSTVTTYLDGQIHEVRDAGNWAESSTLLDAAGAERHISSQHEETTFLTASFRSVEIDDAMNKHDIVRFGQTTLIALSLCAGNHSQTD